MLVDNFLLFTMLTKVRIEQGTTEFQPVRHLKIITKTFVFLNFLGYFVKLKNNIAYAGELHFHFCGHCGSDSGNLSDRLAYVPQKKLTPKPR
jgi:hypothetical protein